MSKLAEFRQLEKNLAEQLKALEALKDDATLMKEIEFESKIRDLLAQYDYSLRDVINLIDPQTRRTTVATVSKVSRRPRQIKVYKNPNTDEVVETKGGNHKVLKEWKSRYGSEVVDSWIIK